MYINKDLDDQLKLYDNLSKEQIKDAKGYDICVENEEVKELLSLVSETLNYLDLQKAKYQIREAYEKDGANGQAYANSIVNARRLLLFFKVYNSAIN
jgi:hypothetical protein